jgi:hypothetical protein
MPVFGQLTMIDSIPPTYYLLVNDKVAKLTTEELCSPRLLQKRVLDTAHVMMPIPSQAGWQKIVQSLLNTIIVKDVPEEERGPRSTFQSLLNKYLETRAPAQHKEQVASGVPWTDHKTHTTWFNIDGLMSFLSRARAEGMTKDRVTAFLHEIKAEHRRFRDIPKPTWVWGMPEIEKPKRPDEVIEGDFFDEAQK